MEIGVFMFYVLFRWSKHVFSYNTTALHSPCRPLSISSVWAPLIPGHSSRSTSPNTLFHFQYSSSPSPSSSHSPLHTNALHPLLPFCCFLRTAPAPLIPLPLGVSFVWDSSVHDPRYLILLYISKGAVFLHLDGSENEPLYESEALLLSPHTSPLPRIVAACDSELRVFYEVFSLPLLFHLGTRGTAEEIRGELGWTGEEVRGIQGQFPGVFERSKEFLTQEQREVLIRMVWEEAEREEPIVPFSPPSPTEQDAIVLKPLKPVQQNNDFVLKMCACLVRYFRVHPKSIKAHVREYGIAPCTFEDYRKDIEDFVYKTRNPNINPNPIVIGEQITEEEIHSLVFHRRHKLRYLLLPDANFSSNILDCLVGYFRLRSKVSRRSHSRAHGIPLTTFNKYCAAVLDFVTKKTGLEHVQLDDIFVGSHVTKVEIMSIILKRTMNKRCPMGAKKFGCCP